jgi:hypothetical protein
MTRKGLDRYAFVFVLLAVSLFSFTPARADQIQPQSGTVAFHLTGQATSMNTTVGSLGSAKLDLAGGGFADGQGGLMIQNVTGNLQIGSVNFSIFTGDGKSDSLGELEMIAESSSGELVLHGTVQHNSTVTTDAPSSTLSSLAYLALSGSMTLGDTGSNSAMNVELSQNVTSTIEMENGTSTNTSVNSTSEITQSESSTLSIANVTSQTEVSTENATLSVSNTTSLGQTIPSPALPEQKNTTMTATQFNNQTITLYVSSTVANSTITQKTTTTVANTTITQVSSITVSNTTVIVTNSTNSSH